MAAIKPGIAPLHRLRLKCHAAVTRLSSSPRFIRAALWFWPTRLIARRQASRLFDLVSGFVYSQILGVAVRLNLFDLLQTPRTVDDISQQTNLKSLATERLLRATTALKLTRKLPANHYGLGSLGAALVANEGLQAMVEHHSLLYRDLCEPEQLFTHNTATALGEYWSYSAGNETNTSNCSAREVTAYSALMAKSQPMISQQVLACYDFSQHKKMVDVGGGTGRFLQSVRQKYPQLEMLLFDLPAVQSVSDHEALDKQRIQRSSGDFLHDPLPGNADLISLIRILHDHDDAAVKVLLKNIYIALPANGTLLIAEPMSGTPGADRVGEAYFNIYFLAMGKGEPRSINRLKALLTASGFVDVKVQRTALPLVCSVITARKP